MVRMKEGPRMTSRFLARAPGGMMVPVDVLGKLGGGGELGVEM